LRRWPRSLRPGDDAAAELEAALRDRGTTAQRVLAETLRELDVEATLRGGGLSGPEVQRLRARMLVG
jgi:hypothetical protein